MTALAVVTTTAPQGNDLAHLLDALGKWQHQLALPIKVVVVDDLQYWHGKDEADQWLAQHASLHAALDVTPVRHTVPKGQLQALAAGARLHRDLPTLFIDPDMHASLGALPDILAALRNGKQIVHCVRLSRPDLGLLRRFGSWLANVMVRRLAGLPLADINSPMLAMTPAVMAAAGETPEAHGNPRLYLYRLFLNQLGCVPVTVSLPTGHRSHYRTLTLARLFIALAHDCLKVRQVRPLPAAGLPADARSAG